MKAWGLRFGMHRDLGKQILESSRLEDTIRVTDSVCYVETADRMIRWTRAPAIYRRKAGGGELIR